MVIIRPGDLIVSSKREWIDFVLAVDDHRATVMCVWPRSDEQFFCFDRRDYPHPISTVIRGDK